MRHKKLSWADVDKLIDELVPQLNTVGAFGAMVMITRGGIIPGGLLAEALNISDILTAAVDFPAAAGGGLLAMPSFLQFPDASLLRDRKILVVDDVWGSGRTSTSVKERVLAAGATAFTCVLHFNPYRSLFTKAKPDFYGEATDSYIVYPWEVDRGTYGLLLESPSPVPDTN
ncbi:MAG: phosphoribosyltransferase family protein [Anaerolineae bacterium]|nr:phosphoribosyltransferase family protein [Anaerolineae bacterium]MDW8171309.1 phosphoribosyltransferase family protein [Anaerolineae bacterium]